MENTMSQNTFLISMIIASFAAFVFSVTPLTSSKQGTVTIDHDNVEVSFLPTNSLYQKRCLTQLGMVYCADTACLATVVADSDGVEIDFIADAQ